MDSVALLVCPRGSSSSAGSQEKGNFHYFLAVLSLLNFSIVPLPSKQGERNIA